MSVPTVSKSEKLYPEEGLKHRDDKVTVHLLFVLLDNTDRGTRTKLLDALTPLVCEELFVDDNHRSVPQFTRYGQGYRRLTVAAW